MVSGKQVKPSAPKPLAGVLLACVLTATTPSSPAGSGEVKVSAGASIQDVIDANPGRNIRLDAVEYRIDSPIVIQRDHTGLYGMATIVQTKPDANIIEIRSASNVILEGLMLTRAQPTTPATGNGVYIERATNFRLTNLTIVDNRSSGSAIHVERSQNGQIGSCEILNYKRIGIDDRTHSALYGYAFRAIVGHGIAVKASNNLLLSRNSVVENHIRSDRDTKLQHGLGRLVEGKYPTKKGQYAPSGDYVSNWHQGSAILVTDPEISSHILISENLIQNAAQGIDIHADQVTLSSNIIDHAFIGVKVMHGARNVIVANNIVSHSDLWGLVMQPGTAAHSGNQKERPSVPPNVTSGNIITGNIFSDFGYGHDYHNWKDSDGRNVLQFSVGPIDNAPVMRNMLVTANIVYDPGRDSESGDLGPRYNYAVFLGSKVNPAEIHFSGNSFHPGSKGISNVVLHQDR